MEIPMDFGGVSMKRRIATYLTLGLAVSFCFMLFSGLSEAKEVTENILRLHITANSNDADDQKIKLLVRDAVLEEGGRVFAGAENPEKALQIAEDSEQVFVSAAQRAIKKAGKNNAVAFAVEKRYFPTRIYDGGIRLPAGIYNAVTLSIGKGEGQNWWCIMYPALCISDSVSADSVFDDVLSGGGLKLIRYPAPAEVEVKFKLVEWFEILKQKICGKA